MTTITTEKIVDWRLYNPANGLFAKKNDCAEFRIIRCTGYGNCDAYKSGNCIMFKFSHEKCPYGKKTLEKGYTQRARKFHSWIEERRNRMKDVPQLSEQKKICKIGDYIYFPYPHWTIDRNVPASKRSGLFQSGQQFICIEQFTIDFFEKIVNAKPQAIMGGEIKSYQKEVVPKIVLHISEEMPEFYHEWKSKYPDTEKKFDLHDFVGRSAKIKTLKVGCLIVNGNKKMRWDGEYMQFEDYKLLLFDFPYDCVELKVRPTDNATIKITNNNQVCETTEFID